jgi:methylenetetrahydrofolate--tRNA-(uracil-5-)-methyltransferase
VESAALGGLAGLFAACAAHGEAPPFPPDTTAHAALLRHLRGGDPARFQPMNATYGLFPSLAGEQARLPRRQRHELLAERALRDLAPWALACEPSAGCGAS